MQFFTTAAYEPSAYLFDGVVALALAADAGARVQVAADATPTVGSEQLRNDLLRVRFDGASGPVQLNEDGDRKPATIQFALESFVNSSAERMLSLAYKISLPVDEMVSTPVELVQWIGGGKGPDAQPDDNITHEVRDCPPPS